MGMQTENGTSTYGLVTEASGPVPPVKKHSLIASDRVEGTPVRRPNAEKIGTIHRLMIDKESGKVAYAVLNFGGFLGIGERRFPVPWERLTYNKTLEAYELDISKEELEQAPSFAANTDFDWGDRTQEAMIYNYYNMPPYWGF